MKSILCCVMWPCWVWIANPASRWLFASYSETTSIRDSCKCRRLIQSEWYQSRWSNRFQLSSDQNQKIKFENDKTGWRIATSIGGQGTGQHPDYVVFDDPITAGGAMSAAARAACIDWWSGTMSTRGRTRNARLVGIMQRLHDEDLSGHILKKGGYEHLMFPMEFEPERKCKTSLGWEDPRTQPGELLWPAAIDAASLSSMKLEMTSYLIAGQLQQRPSPEGGGMFKRSMFLYFEQERIETLDLKTGEKAGVDYIFTLHCRDGTVKKYALGSCKLFQTCDTASKTGKDNDYTVVSTFALTPERELLVLDVWREKIEIPRQYPAIIQQRVRYPTLLFQAIEDADSGTGLLQLGAMAGTPFKRLTADKDKTRRAVPISTFYENGRVYHLADAAWLNDAEEELMLFPAGAHDDIVDTFSYAGVLVVTNALFAASNDRSPLGYPYGSIRQDERQAGILAHETGPYQPFETNEQLLDRVGRQIDEQEGW